MKAKARPAKLTMVLRVSIVDERERTLIESEVGQRYFDLISKALFSFETSLEGEGLRLVATPILSTYEGRR